jgi:hypothetical protein
MVKMDYNVAMAAAADEANRQMEREGRTKWSRADWDLAVDTMDRLWPDPWELSNLAEHEPPLGEPMP